MLSFERPWLPPLLCLAAALPAQGAAEPALQFDDQPLAEPRALLDPLGVLELHGQDAHRRDVAFALHFAELCLPQLGTAPLRAQQRRDEAWIDLPPSELETIAFAAARVAGRLRWETQGQRHELRFDLVPVLGRRVVPTVAGCPPASTNAADDAPDKEDLVFCAIGGTGTGLPGARRVIDSIARLAPSGPLDFVLLLGNNLDRGGVASVNDPLWRERFETAWPRSAFPIPFYAAPGAWDHEGSVGALVDYGIMNERWTMPTTWSYRFVKESRGKTIDFISLDTRSITGSLGVGTNRHAIRMATWLMEQSKADWKIVFGNLALQSAAVDPDAKLRAEFAHRIEWRLKEAKVDLFLSGADHFLELRKPDGAITHVVSGAGGGLEVAHPVRCEPATVCAHTGGGFAWFRFDGAQLEVSLRDADGNALCVHRLTK